MNPRRVRWRRRRRAVLRADSDAGSSAAELVVITPVVIVLLLFVVGLGRYAYSTQLVEQAAAAAARAASLSPTASQAADRAAAAGQASLAGAGLSCETFQVLTDAAAFQPGGTVRVTLTCTANLSDAVLSGLPGHTTVSATCTVPLEMYRQIDSGFSNSEASSAGNPRVGGTR